MVMIPLPIRRMFWALLGLVLLGVGALVAVLTQGDALEQAVLGQIGNSLLTRGHITAIDLNVWDDFPLVSLSLEDVWVAGSGTGGPGAGPFSGDTLMRADRIGLTLDALSLLSERPEVRALTLEGATLVVAERADGAWNTAVWRAGDDAGAVAFAVDAVRLRDVRLQIGPTPVFVADAQCSGELDEAGLHAQIRSDLTAYGIPLEAATRLDQSGDRWDFTELTARAWGAEATGTLRADAGGVQMDLAYEGLKINRLQDAGIVPKSSDWSTQAPLRGHIEWDGTTWKGHAKWAQAAVDLPSGLASWVEDAPALPFEATSTGTCWFRSDPNGLRLDVPRLLVNAPGLGSEGELHWTAASVQWEGSVRLQPTALVALPSLPDITWNQGAAQAAVTVYADRGEWGVTGNFELIDVTGEASEVPYKISAQGQLGNDRLHLLAANGAIGAIPFDASGSLDHPFGGGSFNGSLDLHVPYYAMQASSDGSNEPWWNAWILPPGSAYDIRLKLDTLRWEGNTWTHLEASGRLQPNRMAGTGRAAAYNGAIQWGAELTWFPSGARADINYQAASIDVRQFFLQMADFGQTTLRSDHVTGLLDSEGQAEIHWLPSGEIDGPGLRWHGDQTLREATLQNVEALEAIPDYLSAHRMIAPLVNPSDLREKMRSISLQTVSTSTAYLSERFILPLTNVHSEDLHITVEGEHTLSGAMDYSVGIEIREFSQMLENDIGDIMDDGLGNHLFINIIGAEDDIEFAWDREAQRAHRRREFVKERDKLKGLWENMRNDNQTQ